MCKHFWKSIPTGKTPIKLPLRKDSLQTFAEHKFCQVTKINMPFCNNAIEKKFKSIRKQWILIENG